MKISQLIIGFLCTSLSVYAQQNADSVTQKPNKALFVNANLQYISNLTYAGHKDASSVPILLPTVTLISKYGVFLSGSAYFNVSDRGSQTEGFSITPGYVFSFDKSKYYGGAVSATKYFITNSDPIILSSFNASIDGQLYANPDNIVKLTIAASYRFDKGNTHDIINDAELSKEIAIIKVSEMHKNGFKIAPTLTLYSGTQSFNQTYYTNYVVPQEVDQVTTNPGSSSNGIFGVLFPPGTPSQTITKTVVNQTVTEEKQREVRKYQVLAASASVPLTYTVKKVQFVATPYFIKPFNQINYTNNTPINGMYFLFTLGANITF